MFYCAPSERKNTIICFSGTSMKFPTLPCNFNEAFNQSKIYLATVNQDYEYLQTDTKQKLEHIKYPAFPKCRGDKLLYI